MSDKPMKQYEFTGDWMSLTVKEYTQHLLLPAKALDAETIVGMVRCPAIRKLNMEARLENGDRQICVVEIPPEKDDEVMIRLFSVHGNSAIFEFFTELHLEDEDWIIKGGFAPGRPQNEDLATQISFQHLFAFCLVQYLMLYGAEKISFRKEYRKALKPARASQLIAPFTQPGKVRVLDISITESEVREHFRRTAAIHTWHCPAWGVRGHYRHYKTGRVSYIKPYVKGKNKDAYAGREYTLPGGGLIAEVMK
ncbi:MAG: hypothetical protein IJ198_14000 [Lachnospiraceae bacterium]|nr:hypothetical protein [Lachnospiraceae bacterium]